MSETIVFDGKNKTYNGGVILKTKKGSKTIIKNYKCINGGIVVIQDD